MGLFFVRLSFSTPSRLLVCSTVDMCDTKVLEAVGSLWNRAFAKGARTTPVRHLGGVLFIKTSWTLWCTLEI